MSKITVTLSIDDDAVLRVSGQENIHDAISQELGWLHDSGMFVDGWSFADAEKQEDQDKEDSSKKLYCLCEEHEDSDAIREFRILAASAEKELLQKLMCAQIAEDPYDMISQNGVEAFNENNFMTTFNDGFVEYYIAEQNTLSRKELEAMLSKLAEQPVTKYAKYNCGDFDGIITKEEYQGLKKSGALDRDNGLDYTPIFDGIIYPTLGESIDAQIDAFGYQYDDDRRTKPSLAEKIQAAASKSSSVSEDKNLSKTIESFPVR